MRRVIRETTLSQVRADAERVQHLVVAGYIFTGPELSFRSIQSRYRCILREDGTDCEGIRRIRELISTIDAHVGMAISIVAPHTHWHAGDAIVEIYDAASRRYLMGPSGVLPRAPQQPLVPMSFVFHRDGLQAFEWTDATSGLSRADQVERLDQGLYELNRAVIGEYGDQLPIPVAVSLNHRFKDSLWGVQLAGTVERPAPECEDYAAVTLKGDTADSDPSIVQVAWSALTPEEYTPEEAEIIRQLEEHLASLSPAAAREFMDDLEDFARLG